MRVRLANSDRQTIRGTYRLYLISIDNLYLISIDNAIDCVAALGAGPVRSNLTDALQHADPDPLLRQASEESPDGMRSPAHRFSNLRSAGTLVTAQHGQDLGLLRVPRRPGRIDFGGCQSLPS